MRVTLFSRRSTGCRQRGAALFIALISLVALSFAGLALMRSVDTTNMISGNLAFRQASLHATDIGVEAAVTALGTIVTTSLDANYPAGCAVGACNYYTLQQAVDTRGVPSSINWGTGGVPSTTVDGSYAVQYVIDRLCKGPAPVTDLAGSCYAAALVGGGTKKSGGIVFSSTVQVYYRATVRVTGPRNTVSMVQILLKR